MTNDASASRRGRLSGSKGTLIRFYLDSHIPKSVATQLRLKGVDVLRCQEINLDNASDVTHLEYAAWEKRTVVSSDEDFLELDARWRGENRFHAGIIFVAHEHQNNVGLLVTEFLFLHEAIEAGAATLENDVYNQVRFIT